MEEENTEATAVLRKLEALRTQAAAAGEVTKHCYKDLPTAIRTKLREADALVERIGEKKKAAESASMNTLLCLKSLSKRHADEANLLEVRVRENRETFSAAEARVREKLEAFAASEARVREKQEELRTLGRHMEAMAKEWESKRAEVYSLQVSREAMLSEIDSIENLSQEVVSRADEFRNVEKAMEECFRKVEAKEREIEGMRERLEMKREELAVRVEEIRAMEKNVDERLNEIVVKEKDTRTLEISIREHGRSVDSAFSEMKVKEADVDERAVELEMFSCRVPSEKLDNERSPASLAKSLEDREVKLSARVKPLDSFSRELEVKDIRLNEQADVQSQKKNDFTSVEKSMEDREKNLNARAESITEWGKSVASVSNKLKWKDRQKSVEDCKRYLDSMFEEFKLKERYVEEFEMEGKQLKALLMSDEKLEKEMELKWKPELTELKLERLFDKFELREKQVELVDERLDGCLSEGLIAERELSEGEEREEWSCKPELTERNIKKLVDKFELRGRQVEPIDTRLNELLSEGLSSASRFSFGTANTIYIGEDEIFVCSDGRSRSLEKKNEGEILNERNPKMSLLAHCIFVVVSGDSDHVEKVVTKVRDAIKVIATDTVSLETVVDFFRTEMGEWKTNHKDQSFDSEILVVGYSSKGKARIYNVEEDKYKKAKHGVYGCGCGSHITRHVMKRFVRKHMMNLTTQEAVQGLLVATAHAALLDGDVGGYSKLLILGKEGEDGRVRGADNEHIIHTMDTHYDEFEEELNRCIFVVACGMPYNIANENWFLREFKDEQILESHILAVGGKPDHATLTIQVLIFEENTRESYRHCPSDPTRIVKLSMRKVDPATPEDNGPFHFYVCMPTQELISFLAEDYFTSEENDL